MKLRTAAGSTACLVAFIALAISICAIPASAFSPLIRTQASFRCDSARAAVPTGASDLTPIAVSPEPGPSVCTSLHIADAFTLDPTQALSDLLGGLINSPAILLVPILAAIGVASLIAFFIVGYATPQVDDDDE